jgi:membrane-bound lytic murein transglycosylase B
MLLTFFQPFCESARAHAAIVRYLLVGITSLLLLFIFSQTSLYAAAEKSAASAVKVPAAELVRDKQPINLKSSKYQLLFAELIDQHGYSQEELETLFEGVSIHKRVLELMDKQWEAKPYYKYRPLFISWPVIRQGKRSLKKFRPLFDAIEAEFGVNREVIVAIWAVESRFGSNTGSFNLFRSLNTLFDAYPRRSDFFRQELLNFLILCKANGIDPLSISGSYAGAFGQAQFMPSSFNTYAVDFDGDNKKDLISSMPDIFASIAHYLKSFGWILDTPLYAELGSELKSEKVKEVYNQGRLGRIDRHELASAQQVTLPPVPEGAELSVVGLESAPGKEAKFRYVAGYPNFQAVTFYNHSHKYAMAVSELAEAFAR